MQFTPYLIPWSVSIILTLTLGIYVLRYRKGQAAQPFAAMCFFAAWWSFTYILEVLLVDRQAKVLAAMLMYIGVLGVPLSWTAFAMAFTGRGAWLTWRLVLPAVFFPVLTLLVIFTSNHHDWFWSRVALSPMPQAGLLLLDTQPGWWFWLHAVYVYFIMLLGTYFLLRQFWEVHDFIRGQIVINLVAIFAPWIANMVVIFHWLPTLLDITSLTFSFSILLLGWGYFRYGFLDLMPVAQRAVFEGIPDGVIVLDPALRVTQSNPAARQIFALDGYGGIGRPFASVFGGWFPLDEATLRTDGLRREVCTELDGASRWFDLSVNTLYGDPNRSVIGHVLTLREVTSFKANEAALAVARDQAIHADGFKTELLAKVSHELRTPLGAISGTVELLETGVPGPLTEKQRTSLSRIRESARYLDGLVSELIDQAMLDSGRIQLTEQDFDPRIVFGQALDQLGVLAGAKHLELSVFIDEELPEFMNGDSQRLRQILINLVANAIKFTELGTVRTSLLRTSRTEWSIQVSDSGPGIPAESLDVIFEPFRRLEHVAKPMVKGYGLGLSISKQIAELMQGRIEVQSQVGQGTTFLVTLPLK